MPLRLTLGLNVIGGLCLGLEGAPILGAIWAVASCVMDGVLLGVLRRRLAVATAVDPDAGLRRLAWIVALRSTMWMAAPTGFAVTSHSPIAIAQSAITALGLAMTAGWTSRPIFYAKIGPVILSIGLICASQFPPLPTAGLLIALAVFCVMTDRLSTATHNAIDQWSKPHSRMLGALDELREALRQSELTKRRLKIAVRLADFVIYEIDYVSGTLTTMGTDPTSSRRNRPLSGW